MLSASDDSNINVWSLARLLDFDAQGEAEPDVVLSNHRAAITDLVAGPGANPETSICVSASKDKTCIIWNYQTGQVLRTLLFPVVPLCVRMDPCARAVYASTEGGALYVVELYGDRPLLGSQAPEPASIVVQVGEPVGVADEEVGEPTCLAPSYDSTTILTGHTKGKILRWSLTKGGHPTELANLNALVSNIILSPLLPIERRVRPVTIVKPQQNQTQYVFSAQIYPDLVQESRFSRMLNAKGFPAQDLEAAILSLTSMAVEGEADILWKIGSAQRASHKAELAQNPIDYEY